MIGSWKLMVTFFQKFYPMRTAREPDNMLVWHRYQMETSLSNPFMMLQPIVEMLNSSQQGPEFSGLLRLLSLLGGKRQCQTGSFDCQKITYCKQMYHVMEMAETMDEFFPSLHGSFNLMGKCILLVWVHQVMPKYVFQLASSWPRTKERCLERSETYLPF